MFIADNIQSGYSFNQGTDFNGIEMDAYLLMTGLAVFVARVFDVSIGTVRTIATVQGRMVLAFFLGIIEVVLWLVVVGTIINRIQTSPILILFFAVGFATGNVVGIIVERELAFGPIILKVITNRKDAEITSMFQSFFLNVTRFRGEGLYGPVTELYVVCHRRDLRILIPAIRNIDANAFFVTEQAREVSRDLKPMCTSATEHGTFLKKLLLAIQGFPGKIDVHGMTINLARHGNVALRYPNAHAGGWRSWFKKK